MGGLILLALLVTQPGTEGMPINRTWDRLSGPSDTRDLRALFEEAAKSLRKPVYVDGVRFDRKRLRRLARLHPGEPFLRVVREAIRRPLDLEDFLYFLDDVLVARETGPFGIWLPASRARRAGIFVHPDDVFQVDTPKLITWVEQHFQMEKLKTDYPHWEDEAAAR